MDSNDSLTPLSTRGQLWLVTGGAEKLQLLAYSGPELRLAPRLWKSDSGAMTVVDERAHPYPRPGV